MPGPRECLLVIVVAIFGLALVRRLAARLDDPRLLRLQALFLLKLAVVVIVLYAGWCPDLLARGERFGYDPQRYFVNAASLLDSGFDLASARDAGLNATGIVWYYAFVFAVAGKGPLGPAAVNALATLLATLVLVEAVSRTRRDPRLWLVGFGMLLPEIVWFDALTSRETLLMALFTIGTLLAGAALTGAPDASRRFVAAGAAFLLVGLVRPAVVLPAAAAVLFVAVFSDPRKRRPRVLALLGAACAVVVLAPAAATFLGSHTADLSNIVETVLAGNKGQMETIVWGDRSLGRLFVSETPLGAFAAAIPRLVLLMIAPLGALPLDVPGLVSGEWPAWQSALQGASAVLNLALVPLAAASLAAALSGRAPRTDLVVVAPCWCLLLATAAGNQIIHERYRVMASLLLWGAAVLGASAPRSMRAGLASAWLGALGAAGAFALFYKLS